jgi:hypothetical protein
MDYYFNIIYLLQNENIPFNVSVSFYKVLLYCLEFLNHKDFFMDCQLIEEKFFLILIVSSDLLTLKDILEYLFILLIFLRPIRALSFDLLILIDKVEYLLII